MFPVGYTLESNLSYQPLPCNYIHTFYIEYIWLYVVMVSVGNVVKIGSNKEEFKSNMETEGLRIKSSIETVGESTGYSMQTMEK